MGVDCLLHSSGQEAENASYPPGNTKTFFFLITDAGTGHLHTTPPPTKGWKLTVERPRQVFVPRAKQSQ